MGLEHGSEQDRAPFDWLGEDSLQPLRRQVRIRRSEVEVERDVGHTGNANGSGRPLASSVRARRLRLRDRPRQSPRRPGDRRAPRARGARGLDDRDRQGRLAQSPRPVVAARRRPRPRAAADDPRLRRRRVRRGGQRGRRPLRYHRRLLARRRDARPAPLDPVRALPGHVRRRGGGPAPKRAAQAARALVRGGRVSADGVADRIPNAVHPRRSSRPARRCSSRARAAASPPR